MDQIAQGRSDHTHCRGSKEHQSPRTQRQCQPCCSLCDPEKDPFCPWASLPSSARNKGLGQIPALAGERDSPPILHLGGQTWSLSKHTFCVRFHLRGREHQRKQTAALWKQTLGQSVSSTANLHRAFRLQIPGTSGCLCFPPRSQETLWPSARSQWQTFLPVFNWENTIVLPVSGTPSTLDRCSRFDGGGIRRISLFLIMLCAMRE